MKKLIYLVLSTLLVSSTLVGCMSNQNSDSSDLSNSEVVSPSESQEIVLSTSKGDVTVPTNPSKIAIFDFSILDMIETLNINVEIAAPISSLPEYLKSFEATLVDGGNIKEPNLEGLFEFQPEIIFVSGRQDSYYEELSKIAPTVYVDLNSSTYIEDMRKNALNIGKIFNKENEANELINSINKEIEEVKAISEQKNEKALIILTNDGGISAYGSGSRFGIIHDVLNVKQADENITVSTHGQEASYEYISEVNPDILFVVDRTKIGGGTNFAETTLDNELIKNTNAGKNNKIFYLDPEIWYLSGGGLKSVTLMINEIKEALLAN